MRIAVVSETWAPEINGVALTVQKYVEQLLALGHQVELTCPRRGENHGVTVPGLEEYRVAGAPIPRYPELRFGLPSPARLHRRWQRLRPDAVYVATEGPLGWSAVSTARSLGIRVATGFHTRFDDFVGHYGAGLLTPLVFAWLRRFHNRADATLVATSELAEQLARRGFRRPIRLGRSVDCERFDPRHRDPCLRQQWGADPAAPVLIHVGRLAVEKNLQLAAAAFAEVQRAIPAARMVWVGDGPALAALRARHPEQHFAGMRLGTDLARHYASADLFLFPSLTDTFGNVTLEAMASGLAVVAFDYAAAGAHIDDGRSGRTVALGDAAAFVSATLELAADPVLRRAIGARARSAVEPGTAQSDGQQLLNILCQTKQREAA